MLFGLFLEAYMHNFNLVYITLFFVFAAAFSAGPLGMRNIGYLEASFSGCDRLFAAEEGACYFEVINTAAVTAWAVELHSAFGSAALPQLPPHAKLRAKLAVTPPQRGRLDAGDCTLQSLFPLATVRFVLNIEKGCELLAYPAPAGEPLQSYLMRRRAPFGDEMDFDGLKRYSGAENVSRIHWPSVAKGEIAVKTFEHEARSDTLLFDFYRCADDDERRLSQLTLWVIECERQHLPFIIDMPQKQLSSGELGTDAILEYLALY